MIPVDCAHIAHQIHRDHESRREDSRLEGLVGLEGGQRGPPGGSGPACRGPAWLAGRGRCPRARPRCGRAAASRRATCSSRPRQSPGDRHRAGRHRSRGSASRGTEASTGSSPVRYPKPGEKPSHPTVYSPARCLATTSPGGSPVSRATSSRSGPSYTTGISVSAASARLACGRGSASSRRSASSPRSRLPGSVITRTVRPLARRPARPLGVPARWRQQAGRPGLPPAAAARRRRLDARRVTRTAPVSRGRVRRPDR